MRTIRPITTAAALALVFAATFSARPPAAAAATDCEGDACSQVTVTFDEAKQQYTARNNSAERWARVSASNVAAAQSVCLGPGKEARLALKSIVGAYRAEYAETRCGEDAITGPPGDE